MRAATPEFFSAPWVAAGQFTVSPDPSVHVSGAAAERYLVKLLVVPDPSERCTTVIFVAGSVASGLSASIAGSAQLVIRPPKIPATVSALRRRSSTPARL